MLLMAAEPWWLRVVMQKARKHSVLLIAIAASRAAMGDNVVVSSHAAKGLKIWEKETKRGNICSTEVRCGLALIALWLQQEARSKIV